MSEQQSTEFDPADFTVDDVNEYLTDADTDERNRVIQAEADGKARQGILEGPHASTDDEVDPEPTSTEGGAQTVAEAGESVLSAEGEKYAKGYDGYVPSRDGDDPVDLTLAAVTADTREG